MENALNDVAKLPEWVDAGLAFFTPGNLIRLGEWVFKRDSSIGLQVVRGALVQGSHSVSLRPDVMALDPEALRLIEEYKRGE